MTGCLSGAFARFSPATRSSHTFNDQFDRKKRCDVVNAEKNIMTRHTHVQDNQAEALSDEQLQATNGRFIQYGFGLIAIEQMQKQL